MENGLLRYIWSRSRGRQLVAIAITLLSLPLLYLSLELPKTIINQAIEGDDWPRRMYDVEIGQIPFLLALCLAFISIVALNALIRHRLNILKASISVQLLSRLRLELVERVLRFPLPQFKKISPGEISNMVMSEVAPFGRFFGDSLAVPVFEGAMFGTILIFVFAQDVYLGLAAIALIPFQAYLVPRLQRRVNVLIESIAIRERELANQIAEVVDGVHDVHAQDVSAHMLEKFRRRLTGVAGEQKELAARASFIRLCHTILGQLPPFFFYGVGGWLVIRGELSFGALVAALAAYRDLTDPWNALLYYYRDLAEARTTFDVVVRQFNPRQIWPAHLQEKPPEELVRLTGPIEAEGLGYEDENGWQILEDVHFRFEPGERVVIVSALGSAREVTASILSRLYLPSAGQLRFSGLDAAEIHQSIAGARIALLDAQPAFFDSTVGENLYLALSAPPKATRASDAGGEPALSASLPGRDRTRASEHPWVHPRLAGLPDRAALRNKTLELFHLLELDADLYDLGLRQHHAPASDESFADEIVSARADVRESLLRLKLNDLIQSFEPDRFNDYSTLGENILFGEAEVESVASDRLAASPVLRQLLRDFDLDNAFFEIGLRCASTLVEILRGLPSEHPFFQQYSLVSEAELPNLAIIVRQSERSGLHSLSDWQRRQILRLTFGLAPQRHRLGLIDEDMKKRIVKLRHTLRSQHEELVTQWVSPYDAESYNPRLSILLNLLFGRILYGRAHAEERVTQVVNDVVNRRGLRDRVVLQALEAPAGVGGKRLTMAVRQKLGVARCLLKRPDVVVIDDMLNALDGATRIRLRDRILEDVRGATLIWLDASVPTDLDFDRCLRIEGNQLHELGPDSMIVAAPPSVAAPVVEDPLLEETAALRNVPLLAQLDSARLKLLAFTGERRSYRPGEIVFRQGQPGEEAYVILSGEAEVLVEREENAAVLYALGPGQMIGELAMLSDAPRSATVRAKTELSALRLNREVFFETLRQDPGFSFEVARDLGRRLVRTTEELRLLSPSE